MVDDQFCGLQRIDLLWIAAKRLHCIAHRGEIDDGRHTCEVLHQHAGRHVGDFAGRLGLGIPLGEEFDVLGRDGFAVFVAKQVFKQNAQAVGQAVEAHALLLENVEAEYLVSAVAGFQLRPAAETVN